MKILIAGNSGSNHTYWSRTQEAQMLSKERSHQVSHSTGLVSWSEILTKIKHYIANRKL